MDWSEVRARLVKEEERLRYKAANLQARGKTVMAAQELVVADDIRAALEEIERRGGAERFLELLEPDAEDREEVRANPEFWATDYKHAYDKLSEIEDARSRKRIAERTADEMRERAEAAEAKLAEVRGMGHALHTQQCSAIEHKALRAEVERLRGAGQLLLDAYGEAHALYDLGECEGSLKMRAALRGGVK